MSPRQPGCRHLLIVGVEQRPTVALCGAKIPADLRCPWHDGDFARCEGFEAGEPLMHVLPPDAPDASAFAPDFLDAHPAFAEIVVDFMAPDWRRASAGPRAGLRRAEPPPKPAQQPARRFFQWTLGSKAEPAPSPVAAAAVESVLELGPEVPVPASPPCQEGTDTRRVATRSRLQPSARFIGDLKLQPRRGHCRVEWLSPGSRADRPPVALRWRAPVESGNLLMGGESVGRTSLVYGTRLRQVPGEDTLANHEDLVCALRLQDGALMWRWRKLSLACAPQVVGDLVLLRGHDGLWGVDAHTGRVQWRSQAVAYHAEAAGIDQGRAFFHDGSTVHAVELRTGRVAWEVEASRHAPRPVACDGRVVLAGEGDLRVLRSGSGALLWRVACQGPDNRTPAMSERHVVFWTWDGQLHGYDAATGRRLWSIRGGTFYPGDDPLLADGRVFFRDGDLGDAWLCAADEATGRLLWRVPLDESLSASVWVSGGVAYVQNSHNDVVALDVKDGALLWRLHAPVSGLVGATGSLVTWSPGSIACLDL